jgi:hypothetical protein
MNMDELKKLYGEEYPGAAVVKGVRMPLTREGRFSRSYRSKEPKMGTEFSRFMDGSASITAAELREEWPTWTRTQRLDFCQSCSWLHLQPDFPDMLRFIIKEGGPDDWSGIAPNVAGALPRDEAFALLLPALRAVPLASTSNIAQGIALTKHPQAGETLRRHLDDLWRQETLWDDAEHVNWLACSATTCIAHLIELGSPPADFEEQVRRLSQHKCSGNRESCRNFLSKHYSWLK